MRFVGHGDKSSVTTQAHPCSPYALTKLHGEHWGALYSRLHGLRFLALRFFSVWGPGQRPDLALESFRRKIEAGQPVVIFGDGTQRRDLTHVSDVARVVELALGWPGHGAVVLNVGTGQNHSVVDMVQAVAKSAAPQVEHQAAHPADVPEAAGFSNDWNQSRNPGLREIDLGDGRILVPCFD